MWIWELRVETDGTQCLRVEISPETPPIVAASIVLSLSRLVCLSEDQEDPLDGDSPSDSESNDFCSGRMSQHPWDFPNWN